MHKKYSLVLMITPLILLISLVNSPFSLGVVKEDPIFSLGLIGARKGGGFGGPCPPNLTEPCTWDAYYVYDVYIRLTYNGDTSCNITKLVVWHQLHVKGITYNHTGPLIIPNPSYLLDKGYFYEFIAIGSFYTQYDGNITVRVTTLTLGSFVLSTGYTMSERLSIIPDWEPNFPTEPLSFGTNVLIFGFLAFVVIQKRMRSRRIKKRKKH
jgi:hypothetical protein